MSPIGRRLHRVGAFKIAIGVVILALGLAAVGFVLTNSADVTPRAAIGAPHFTDVTESAGIDHVYAGDASFAVGGGVAAFDCMGDGKPDLYFAGGSNPAALYRNDSPTGGPLQFTRVSDPTTDLVGVLGAYPIRIAGDGNIDLVVLRKGDAVILRGLGECRFEPANELWSFAAGTGQVTAFSAKWEGSAALPTLALGRYLRLDSSGQPTFDCDDNALFRPNSDSSGYDPPTPLTPGYCNLSMLFSDWDRSGRRDLRLTNDRQYYIDGQDQLWRIASGESPRLYTDADGWVKLQIWGMGIASFDVTGRGYPDVFLTSQGDNKLQTLAAGPGQPGYRDMALKRGVTLAQPFTGGDVRPSTAWHPEFQDVNNDGFIDLFVSKGNVNAMPDYANRDPSDLLLGQADGTFKEAADAAGILNYGRGRGAVLADFTLGGLLDLVEVNYGDRVKVWRNVGSGTPERAAPMGNWLGIRLSQSGANRDAIGAWIEVEVGKTTLRRELTIGGGHAGGQLGWTHFGLGVARETQVRVQWPDGELGPWMHVNANQFVVIDRNAPEPAAWRSQDVPTHAPPLPTPAAPAADAQLPADAPAPADAPPPGPTPAAPVPVIVTAWTPPPRTRTAGCVTQAGLPDAACTPGAVDPRVNANTLATTICTSGYTARVRPPANITDRIKRERMVAYGVQSQSPNSFELDHLISLELGGAPADMANLWPEPLIGDANAHMKDSVETFLKTEVCRGRLSLAEAQQEIATDWLAVYRARDLKASP